MSLQALSIDKILRRRKSPKSTKDIVYSTLGVLSRNMIRTESLAGSARGVSYKLNTENVFSEGLDSSQLQMLSMLAAQMEGDRTMVQFAVELSYYAKGEHKNFVPSSRLLEVMSKINVDLPVEHLFKEINLYFELDGRVKDPVDGKPLDFLICSTHKRLPSDEHYHLGVSTIDSFQCPRTYYIELLPGKTFKQVISEIGASVTRIGEVDLKGSSLDASEDPLLKLAVNLILYVSNPNEQFTEEMNKFSTKKSKREVEKSLYTSKPFIRIGFEAEFLKLITEEKVNVSDHFRWQPHGAGRSLIKLILIKGFTRNYKRVNVLEEKA